MIPAVEIGGARVFLGDCRDVLKTLLDNSVDSIVTDPPYELGFMGKKWDNSGIAYDVTVWQECLRVLKPGGHILAFGGTRTWHRLAVAIEDAGFEIRDTIAWISSKTFPKSLNVSKALVKSGRDGSAAEGWGTALKPAFEPIVVGRKPLVGTVAENVLLWGVGGLNIDGSRIGTNGEKIAEFGTLTKSVGGLLNNTGEPMDPGKLRASYDKTNTMGRWPANVVLDEVSAGLLDEQSGVLKSGDRSPTKQRSVAEYNFNDTASTVNTFSGDKGGASRFFYVAKASKRDRNEGLEDLDFSRVGSFNGNVDVTPGRKIGANPDQPNLPGKNHHPTVKPTQLMRYLIKLVTPEGGTVLDPFTGSGSTGKAALLDGYEFIGAELTEEYLPIIEGRLRWASEQTGDDDDTLF